MIRAAIAPLCTAGGLNAYLQPMGGVRMSFVEHSSAEWQLRRPGSRLRLVKDTSIGSDTKVVESLALIFQECEPGTGAPSHTHEFDEVLTVVEGTAEVWAGDVSRAVGPGASVFVPAGVVHGFRNNRDTLLRIEGVIAATELTAIFVEEPSPDAE